MNITETDQLHIFEFTLIHLFNMHTLQKQQQQQWILSTKKTKKDSYPFWPIIFFQVLPNEC